MSEPTAYTEEELLEMFILNTRAIAIEWSKTPDLSPIDRCNGVVSSILSLLDGKTVDFPACDLLPRPHEEDKAYCIENGLRWVKEGTTLSFWLHEEYGKRVDAWGRLNDERGYD